MKGKKLSLLIILLLLAVGFAAVTTNLILNGNTKIGMANFDVYYSKAEAPNPDDYIEISGDRHTLNFNTRVLSMAQEDYSEFFYEITNDSYEYDAEVEFTLNISASFDYSDYIYAVLLYSQNDEVYQINTGTTITIPAQETVEGMIGVQLIKPVTEDATIDFGLDINPLPKSRLSAIPMPPTPYTPYQELEPGLYDTSLSMTKSWDDLLDDQIIHVNNGVLSSNFNYDGTNEIALQAIGHKDGDTSNIVSISKMSNSLNEILGASSFISISDDYYDFFMEHNSSCPSLNGILVVDESVYKTLDYNFVCPGLKGVVFKKANKNTYDDNYLGFANIKLFNIPIEDVVSSREPYNQYYVTANKLIDGDFVYNDLSKTSIAAYIGTSRNIVIPEGVNDIGPSAFALDNIDTISFPSSYTEIEEYDLFGAFFNDLVIPSTIETISRYGLSYASYNSLTLSEGLKTIGDGAFNDLENLTIPDSVENISDYAFNSVKNLFITRDEYPRNRWGADYINPYTNGDFLLGDIGSTILYEYTGNDSHVVVPSSVNIIDYGVFKNNKTVTNIDLPSSLVDIWGQAFAECTNIDNLVIPDSVENIEDKAFNNVVNVIYYGDNWSSKTGAKYHNQYALNKMVYSDTSLKKVVGYGGSDTSIVIPEGVETIGKNAIRSSTITSVSLPSTLKYLEECSLCSNRIESITLPDGLLEIGPYAISSNRITNIDVPSSVTKIGNGAFASNSVNTVFVNLPNVLPNDMSAKSLSGVIALYSGTATLPSNKYGAKGFNSYIEGDWVYTNSTKQTVISYIPSTYDSTDGVTLSIPEGVEIIGEEAFGDMSYLKKVIIPNTVRRIEQFSFIRCKITELELGSNVQYIGQMAFMSNSLSEIYIPSSLTYIGHHAFDNSGSPKTKVYFPENSTWYYTTGKLGSENISIDSGILSDPDVIGKWLTKDKTDYSWGKN